ncbi:MAG: aminotransferase class III-fold pyridoxal phosphate-dependent enzyme, partial [Mangrovicoccus sp.]
QVIRDAGGLILCDEVQPGFGRLGSHFWGHDWLGFVPDVITTGKPMANGYPMASVITKPEVMAAFRSAFGYFNTFAGTPVAAAAAMAVLDVLEDEQLQANAAQSGAAALARLQDLRHPLIKEIRGKGLFFGVVFEHADQRPARGFTQQVVESMRNRGVLLNAIGRDMNILKFRPPMPFGLDHVDLAMNSLEQVLAELPYDP